MDVGTQWVGNQTITTVVKILRVISSNSKFGIRSRPGC